MAGYSWNGGTLAQAWRNMRVTYMKWLQTHKFSTLGWSSQSHWEHTHQGRLCDTFCETSDLMTVDFPAPGSLSHVHSAASHKATRKSMTGYVSPDVWQDQRSTITTVGDTEVNSDPGNMLTSTQTFFHHDEPHNRCHISRTWYLEWWCLTLICLSDTYIYLFWCVKLSWCLFVLLSFTHTVCPVAAKVKPGDVCTNISLSR